jgi:hypothetical protein
MIKGLCGKDDTDKEARYRKYKNLIENYHSVIEPFISKTKGFSSYREAVAFFILSHFWYNYVKSNSNILFAWANLINRD